MGAAQSGGSRTISGTSVGSPPWAPLARSLGSLTRQGTVSELLRGAPSGAGFVTGAVRTRTESRGIWSHDDSGQPPARRLGDYRQQPPAGAAARAAAARLLYAVRCCQSAAYSTVQYSTVQQRTVIFILDLCDLIYKRADMAESGLHPHATARRSWSSCALRHTKETL